MSKKQMPLVIGGAVFGVLALALGAYVWMASSGSSEADEALGAQKSKLRRLAQREVYPSAQNAESRSEQLKEYGEYLEALQADLRKGQAPEPEVTRDMFQKELQQTLRDLSLLARSKGIMVPPLSMFLYGFDRYRGAMVQENDLARLMSQVRSVKRICTVLYESGISSLMVVERQLFEGGAEAAAAPEGDDGARRRRRGREEEKPVAENPNALFQDPDGLFTKEHFAVVFRSSEKALWTILDRFAKEAPFTVVTRVDVKNPAVPLLPPPKEAEEALLPAAPGPVSTTGFRTVGQAAQAQKEDTAPTSRDLRVVAGMDLPIVRLELDVYRFADAPAEDAEEEGQP